MTSAGSFSGGTSETKVKGLAKGTTTITYSVPATDNFNSATTNVTITVLDSTTPTITLTPTSVSMGSGKDYKYVTVKVQNLPVGTPLVLKVTGKSGAYKAVLLNDLKASQTKNGLKVYFTNPNGETTIKLTPKYNGTYTLQASAAGATTKSATLTVTGHSSLPKTGPDFTLVFVFAGLLIVSIGGIILVNTMKKKQEEEGNIAE